MVIIVLRAKQASYYSLFFTFSVVGTQSFFFYCLARCVVFLHPLRYEAFHLLYLDELRPLSGLLCFTGL